MSMFRLPSNSLLHDRSSLLSFSSPLMNHEESPTVSHSTIPSRHSNGDSANTYTALTFSDVNWRLSGSDIPVSPNVNPLLQADNKANTTSAVHRALSNLSAHAHHLVSDSASQNHSSHVSHNDAGSHNNSNHSSNASTLTTPVVTHSTPHITTPMIHHTPLLDPSMHDRVITDLADFANLIDTNAYFNTTDQTHALSHYPTPPQSSNGEQGHSDVAHGYSSNRRCRGSRRSKHDDKEEKPKKKKKRSRSPSSSPKVDLSSSAPVQPVTIAKRVIESLKQSYSKQYEQQVANMQQRGIDAEQEVQSRPYTGRKLAHNHGLDINALTGMQHVEGRCGCLIKGVAPVPMQDPYDPSRHPFQLADSMREIVAAVHARFGLNITEHLLDKARVQQRALQRAIDLRLQECGHTIDNAGNGRGI